MQLLLMEYPQHSRKDFRKILVDFSSVLLYSVRFFMNEDIVGVFPSFPEINKPLDLSKYEVW